MYLTFIDHSLYANQFFVNCIYTHTVLCCAQRLSRVRLFATPWTAARQAPLSMGFSRQELPRPPQGIFPTQVSCTAGGFLTNYTLYTIHFVYTSQICR